jgi:DNA polymerase III epsilon subunit family exonuclease
MSRASFNMPLSTIESDLLLRYFPRGIVAIDLETTGLSPLSDKIIEIACIKLDHQREITTFHTLINPARSIPEFTTSIHGITDDMIQSQPLFHEVKNEFCDFLGGYPLVAHNAQFDVGFIVKECFSADAQLSNNKVYDSCKIARQAFRHTETAPENYKLSTLMNFFKLEFAHHQALADAAASLIIVAKTLAMAQNKKPLQLEPHLMLHRYSEKSLLPLPEHLKGLDQVIQNKENTYIRYRGSSVGDKFRPIRPISLLPMPAGLTLYAECLMSRLYKSFSIKKILDFNNNPNESERVTYE